MSSALRGALLWTAAREADDRGVWYSTAAVQAGLLGCVFMQSHVPGPGGPAIDRLWFLSGMTHAREFADPAVGQGLHFAGVDLLLWLGLMRTRVKGTSCRL